MPPRSLYTIPPEKFLFNKKNDNPEEHVRQWALFELMSTYGYHITNIDIEKNVKIGSRKFRADIVVHNNSQPFIVIECKNEEINNQDEWDQVLSYSERLQAEYAVWTNGHEWIVKRRMLGTWRSASDIPGRKQVAQIDFAEQIETLELLAPPFYWHNRSISPKDTTTFFYSLTDLLGNAELKKLSNAPKSLQEGFHQLVYLAIDIASPESLSEDFYQMELIGRLKAVLTRFDRFFRRIDFDGKIEGLAVSYKIDRSIQTLSQAVNSEEAFLKFKQRTSQHFGNITSFVKWEAKLFVDAIRYLAKNIQDIQTHSASYLTASEAVTRYIQNSDSKTQMELTEGQVDQILKLLEQIYLAPMRTYLPSKIDPASTGKLHDFCEPYWKDFSRRMHTSKKNRGKISDIGFEIIEPDSPKYEELKEVIEDLEEQLEEDWSEGQFDDDPDDV